MNILFVDQFSELGGAQQCLIDLLPAIQQRGWQAHVAAPGVGPLMQKVRSLGIPYHPLADHDYTNGRKRMNDAIRFARALPEVGAHLARLIREHAIDLLYVNGPRILPAAAFANCPIVFHAHSVVTQRSARVIEGLTLRRTGASVIAVSEFAAAPLRRFVRDRRIRVIHNGVPDLGVRSCRPPGPWRIGFVGRIAPEKGVLDFVRAARIVARCRDDVQFVVCGAPVFSEISYARRVQAEACDAPITFCGWQEDIRPILHSLDLVVSPSAPHDAAPRVILEAFSAGLPVVAYRCGGIPELVDTSSGVLVQDASVDALAFAIGSLLNNPQRLIDMSINARRSWAERFQLQRYSEEIVQALEQIGEAREMQRPQARRQPPPQSEPPHSRTVAR
jgi:glycosyltransferase involved in cell wall biosynthesis